MSLLTQEQQETVEYVRTGTKKINDCVKTWKEYTPEAADTFGGYIYDLLDVIDDLQTRHSERKQYTEQELREAFEREIDKESGYASPMHFHCDLDIWMQCARCLGALKAEP